MTQPQGDAGQSGDGQGGTASDGAGSDGGGDGFKPITSQDALDRIVGERAARAKAAGRTEAEAEFQALINDSRTDTEKLRDELTELRNERATERVETLRLKTANAHGITDAEDVRLFLTGTDEQTLTAQAKRLAQRDADRKKHGNHVPNEGTSAPVGGGTDREAVRAIFGGD